MRLALLLVLVAGCFSPNPPLLAPCDTNDECPSSQQCIFGQCAIDEDHGARIGFAAATSIEDEKSGTVSVSVVLSKPALVPVTVAYEVVGGTATLDVDYSFVPGSLTFAVGETTQSFELTIALDAEEEVDETIELALTSATGGVLENSTHTITISANVLPRVDFSAATASGLESVPGSVDVVLDAASGLTVTVDYTVSGTAGTSDRSVVAGTLTFAPGVTTQPLPLGVINDALDENDETVILTLGALTNAKAGTTVEETYTILDDDATPTVRFTSSAATIIENATTVTLTAQLSAASGRTVTVVFGANVSSTATAPADYSYSTASPLSFAPGITTRSIVIAIVEDTAAEADETVITTLSAPVNATLGTISTHTLTINDDDRTCFGSGAYTTCVATPTVARTLPSSIDTDNSTLCGPQPIGWAGQGQPAVCAISGTTIDIPGTTTVTGSRPLVLVATSVTIGGTLDVSSRRGGTSGPGALACTFVATPDNRNGGAGGGAGGSFATRGGNGGGGDAGAGAGGQSALASATSVLRAGCDGQLAGKSSNDNPGAIGRGGGAVYIVASDSITITGSINASGSGGTLGAKQAGGSGGGSGGMIKLETASLSIAGATLIANGGGGAGGGGSVTGGASGADPQLGAPLSPANGGVSSGGGGGSGFAGATAATAGSTGSSSTGGGGGGGGGGFIQSNQTLAGATVSAGLVSAP